MATNHVLLEKIAVGAAGASSVTFSGIPQTGYTDLIIKVSIRTARTNDAGGDDLKLYFNGDTGSNYSTRTVIGTGASIASENISSSALGIYGIAASNNSTANTFGNGKIYIPNYTASVKKTVSTDTVSENNASGAYMRFGTGHWNSTSAITSIKFEPGTGPTFMQYSTFYLYGVAALGTTPAISPKATGGDTIMTDGTYWYHAFKASGTFTPVTTLSCDVLVVAGGGGSAEIGGGGGAGGVIAFASQSLSSAQTVTVGAGGAGSAGSSAQNGTNGTNSQFASLTAAVGGGGGATVYLTAAGNGGSGGGTSRGGGTVGTGTSGQGFAGGSGSFSPNSLAGGGGGAGAVGASALSGTVSGAGGAGVNTVTNWGALSSALTATELGVSGYIAGGGGGGNYTPGTAGGAGGSGGGGAGVTGLNTSGNSGTANTGGGGGGAGGSTGGGVGGSGGSGLVIVRYAV